MNLPYVVKEVTKGLPEEIREDCLSRILLTGGNTDLAGFEMRLKQDLKEILPEYANTLEVKSCPGTHSWNVAMGSTYVPLAVHPGKYIDLLKLFNLLKFIFILASTLFLFYVNNFTLLFLIQYNRSLFDSSELIEKNFFSDKTPPEYMVGNPFWLSREEYIMFGCESLANQQQ